MKSVLITGGAGFLGSHLASKFISAGYRVVVVDNLSSSDMSNVDYLKTFGDQVYFVEADVVKEWSWLSSVPQEFLEAVEYVFHFASPASPPIYQRLGLETMWVNTLGLERALSFADEKKAKVIFASTSEIYGDPHISPQPESYWGNVNTVGERSCYDEAKRFGESLIHTWNLRYKTRHGLVRIFNTYGPRMNPHDGRVVVNFLVQGLQGQDLTVYGDGSQTRSFCYVDDLIEGIYQYALRDIVEPVNIGNPHEFTILELAEKVQKIFAEKKLNLVFKPLPSDDPKQRRPQIEKAIKLLGGWRPVVNLDEGLRRMLQQLVLKD